MQYFECKHCKRILKGEDVFKIVISYNPSVSTETEEIRYMCFECMKKISNFIKSEDKEHGWFYDELKEIPEKVYENLPPFKNFHCRCVSIPTEKKTRIHDIIDVKKLKVKNNE